MLRFAAGYDRRHTPTLAGDELVLEAAVNGQANAIVTLNESHLRDARKNFGIEVMRPAEALRRIKK